MELGEAADGRNRRGVQGHDFSYARWMQYGVPGQRRDISVTCDPKSTSITINLTSGNLLVSGQATKTGSGELKVVTPEAVITDEGTEFWIIAMEDTTTVFGLKGKVRISANEDKKDWYLLDPDDVAWKKKGQKLNRFSLLTKVLQEFDRAPFVEIEPETQGRLLWYTENAVLFKASADEKRFWSIFQGLPDSVVRQIRGTLVVEPRLALGVTSSQGLECDVTSKVWKSDEYVLLGGSAVWPWEVLPKNFRRCDLSVSGRPQFRILLFDRVSAWQDLPNMVLPVDVGVKFSMHGLLDWLVEFSVSSYQKLAAILVGILGLLAYIFRRHTRVTKVLAIGSRMLIAWRGGDPGNEEEGRVAQDKQDNEKLRKKVGS
jgi:hypothetical protein